MSWKEHEVSPNGAVLAQFRLLLAAHVYVNYLPPYTCFLFPKMEVTIFLYLTELLRIEDNVYEVPGPLKSSPKVAAIILPLPLAVASVHQAATHRRRENLRSPCHLMALLPAVDDPKQ